MAPSRIFIAAMILALTLGCALHGGAALAASKEQIQEARAEIRQMSQDTLASLYKLRPSAKTAIDRCAGYAVFSNFGTKLLFFGGGKGEGIAIDKKAKKEVFMRMLEAQAGWGIGIKKFRVVLLFDRQADLQRFIEEGWEFGGQSSAGLKMEDEGAAYAGAISVSPGVWMYQITDQGVSMELTGKATKYYKDRDLN
ncbi:MAG: hypothetical protein K9K66_01105 [Desulfarculaceae bacterium]|nr:hypothetical protein [Desulfarculaceae bacterium]MCF8072311.1 hypothetical protein [Desulfarculaceae bacterium]MCF8100232.1 hypothetical protein [Desulfarculaceae bacterium]MCF8116195.1 hypothetical protein [Desulfarculaceae bacterium]